MINDIARDYLFSMSIRFCEKNDISYPLIRTPTYAYQWLRNVSFFAYVLNEITPKFFQILKKFFTVLLEMFLKPISA